MRGDEPLHESPSARLKCMNIRIERNPNHTTQNPRQAQLVRMTGKVEER
jgi:hypothetical protein